jgi:hypothetical protein
MNITININTDNDGFQESMNGETARILEVLVMKLRRDEIDIHPGECAYLQDSNGNRVGQLEVTR